MTKRNSNSDIKRKNKAAILRELIRAGEATKPELAFSLHLSLPTVGQIVAELIEAGVVEENGRAVSVGGRRPVSVRVAPGKWLALGINITANHVSFSLVDLNGAVIAHRRSKLHFRMGREYHQELMERLDDLLRENHADRDSLLGVGVVFPGIVTPDHKILLTSHALRIEEPTRFEYDKSFSCPVYYFNDATAACMVECYGDDAPDSFLFLYLSNTVGGAMVINKSIVTGTHNRSGELGHVCVIPGGRQCYCGQRGHYDAYGAAWLLAERAEGDLSRFFAMVEEGVPEMCAALEEYLDMLALLIYNSIALSDLPMILGGYVGNYLGPHLPRLKEKTARLDIFGQSDPDIRLCRCKYEAAATGSAKFFLEQFIESVAQREVRLEAVR